MSRYGEENIFVAFVKKNAKRTAIGVVAFIVLSMAGCPYYNVWEQGMAGRAALMKATQDREDCRPGSGGEEGIGLGIGASGNHSCWRCGRGQQDYR